MMTLTPEDKERRTRLYAACTTGDAAVVSQLLTELSSTIGSTPIVTGIASGALDRAAENGHLEASRVILDHAVAANFDRGTWLHEALCRAVYGMFGKGYVGVVRFLLDRGALIETQRPGAFSRGSALHKAIEDRRARHLFSEEIINLLIQRGADVNWNDGSWSLLYHVCRGGTGSQVAAPVAIARLLIESGAVVDTRTSLGHTPLDAAIMYMRVDCADLLLRSGADIWPILQRLSNYRTVGLFYGRTGPTPEMVAFARPRIEAALRDVILEGGRGWARIGELAFLAPRICEFWSSGVASP